MESSGEDPTATGGRVSNLPHPRVNKTKQHTLKLLDLYSLVKYDDVIDDESEDEKDEEDESEEEEKMERFIDINDIMDMMMIDEVEEGEEEDKGQRLRVNDSGIQGMSDAHKRLETIRCRTWKRAQLSATPSVLHVMIPRPNCST